MTRAGNHDEERKFAAETDGERVSFLLLAGLGAGSWVYDRLIPYLPDSKSILAVSIADLVLDGDGTDPAVDAAIATLRGLLLSFEGSVVVVGHSLGAIIALALASTPITNLKAVVALDAGPRYSASADLVGGDAEIESAARSLFPETKMSETLDQWVRDMAYSAANQERLIEDFRSAPAHLLRDVFVGGRKMQLRLDPSALRVPVLAVAACEDDNDIVRCSADLEARYAGAEVEVATICGTSHYLMLDDPQATAQAIARFLDTLSGECATL